MEIARKDITSKDWKAIVSIRRLIRNELIQIANNMETASSRSLYMQFVMVERWKYELEKLEKKYGYPLPRSKL